MKRATKCLLPAVALALTLLPGASQADEVGETAYMQYCATCHGVEGDGLGPLAEMITEKVPGLRGLSAANDGEFPMLQVIHIIDGRTGLRGHGGPMPVYGALFDVEGSFAGEYGAPVYTRGKMLSLAMYLEGIQN